MLVHVTEPDRIRSLGRWYVDPNGSWSIREFEWLDEDGQWSHTIACRWNGDLADVNDKGYPSVFNNGTWFILPKPFYDMAAALIEAAGQL